MAVQKKRPVFRSGLESLESLESLEFRPGFEVGVFDVDVWGVFSSARTAAATYGTSFVAGSIVILHRSHVYEMRVTGGRRRR